MSAVSAAGAPPSTGETDPATDLRGVGERIETLLEASSSGGVVARERAEELVRLVADLYGGGLARMMDILYDLGALTDEVLAGFAADDLVASLLLVHGLHPDDVGTRVERALDTVRPYLGSHGGDVELLGITDAGVVAAAAARHLRRLRVVVGDHVVGGAGRDLRGGPGDHRIRCRGAQCRSSCQRRILGPGIPGPAVAA